MKPQPILLSCALALAVLLGGCKKAESVAPAQPAPKEKAAAPPAAPAAAAGDKQPILLKVKWPVGARYVYRMDMDQHTTNRLPIFPKPMEQNVTVAMTYAVSVPKALPDDGRELEMEFLANEMEVKMGDQVLLSFDSKEPSANDAQNALLGPFRKMIGSKVHVQVDANGKVEKALDLEDWYKSMGDDKTAQGKALLTQQFNEGFFRQMLDYAHIFPDKPVRPGDSWPFQMEIPASGGKIKVDAKISFTGWENRQDHRCVRLASKGKFSAPEGLQALPLGKMTLDDGQLNTISWFDPELGAMIEVESTQTMRLAGDMPAQAPGAGGGKVVVQLGQKVTSNLAEQGKIP
jgi:hypothetical protein